MKLVIAIVAVIAVVLIASAIGHLLLLGAIAGGGFLLGHASGYTQGRLAGRRQRQLGA